MRAWLLALGALVLVGCTGERSDGGLWARQAVLQEVAVSRTPDALRSAHARSLEQSDMDATLANERARLEAALLDCPGTTRRPLELSPANRTRDAVRLRAGDDPVRRATLASLALADWRLRRALDTGSEQFCDDARTALATVSPFVLSLSKGERASAGGASVANAEIPRAVVTVARDPTDPTAAAAAGEAVSADIAFARYVLGWSDAVRTQSPMPQYLAAVYGGAVLGAHTPSGEADAVLTVDRLASEYPDWEPDALYLALT